MLALFALALLCPSGPLQHGAVYTDGPRELAVPLDVPIPVSFPVSFRPEAEHLQVFFDQGLCQFYTGWFFEAERSFLTILKEDPDCPMAFWGVALANQERPLRAAWFARAGWLKRGLASPRERRFLDALARFYSVDGPDEPADLPEPRQAAPGEEVGGASEDALPETDWTIRRPSMDAAEELFADYVAMVEEDADCIEARALLVGHCAWAKDVGYELEGAPLAGKWLSEIVDKEPGYPIHDYRIQLSRPAELPAAAKRAVESWPLSPRSWTRAGWALREEPARLSEAAACFEAAVSGAHSYGTETWTMPSRVPGYVDAAEFLRENVARKGEDPSGDQASLRGLTTWESPRAPSWTLDDAFGESHSLEDYRGRPLLVINFLGMGCVHCMEQLQAVIPFAESFENAGIRIVAIGLQTTEQLRVSIGTDPADTGYPFPVLCDPELGQFKAWHAYDDFLEVALHGTYLVDRTGAVRWIDISHLPFMDIEFLLEEGSRLVGEPK